jgi:hypothetical protein
MAVAPTTDERTLALKKEVNRRKEEIAKLEKPDWKTNRSFSFNEKDKNKEFSLVIIQDVSELLKVAGFLIEKESNFSAAGTYLKIEDMPKFTWCGYKVDDWLSDIGILISKIQINSKRKKLEALEAKLESILSPEMKAQMLLEEIERDLG